MGAVYDPTARMGKQSSESRSPGSGAQGGDRRVRFLTQRFVSRTLKHRDGRAPSQLCKEVQGQGLIWTYFATLLSGWFATAEFYGAGQRVLPLWIHRRITGILNFHL